jgi:acyl transferase domain-containing protein/NADPH:quinone reductase-like Zn-dependent oxidoreductase/acyl carrier protein
VIRGTAVNEDGRSTVLTAPSGPAQQAVVRQALSNGRVAASEISYVEAHGTGTALGDPIEVEALAEVLGQPADAEPCWIGSVKTNFGHLEAAAGITGLIKTVLALQHEYIPPTLHFRTLNPLVSLDGTRMQVAADGRSWPRGSRRRLAGVSSFGFGGTNAHVILEEAPALPASPRQALSYVLPISARSAESLKALAVKYAELLQRPDAPATWDICYTAAVRRTQHEYRGVAVGSTPAELADALTSIARDQVRWDAATGRRLVGRSSGVVFVFSGQGPQWWAMGRQLMAADPVFRAKLEEIAAIMDPVSGWSLLGELAADEPASRVGETAIAQPAIFAIQVGLTTALASRGIEPSAVVGHSVGEIAAAHVAGALTLEQASRLVVHRARVMQQATGKGRMVAASLTADAAHALVAAHPGRLSLAAINSPQSVVLSGDADAVAAVVSNMEDAGTTHRMLPVNYAFHSYQMQSLAPELTRLIGAERSQQPIIPFVSTVLGSRADAGTLGPGYWVRNVTEPVRFAAAIRWCEQAGYDTFVEIGPHPVLAGSIGESLQSPDARIISTLHRGRPELSSVLAAVGRLHAVGHPVDWKRIYPAGRPVALPAYAWQRERYWMERPEPVAVVAVASQPAGASLVGTRVRSPLFTDIVFERQFTATSPAFVADHRIHDAIVFPAAGFVAMACGAATEAFGTSAAALRDVAIHEPLVLEPSPRSVQVIVSRSGESASFRIVSLASEADNTWSAHATGYIDLVAGESTIPDAPVAMYAAAPVLTAAEHYARMAERGCAFGPAFRRVRRISRAGKCAVADVDAGPGGVLVDAGVLDSCLQALNALLPDEGTYLPVAIDRIRLFGPLEGDVRAVATLDEAASSADGENARIVVADPTAGRVLLEIDGFRLRRTTRAAVLRALRRVPDEWLYRVAWEAAPLASVVAAPDHRRWIVVADDGSLADRLVSHLHSAGCEAVVVRPDAPRADIVRAIVESSVAPAGVVHFVAEGGAALIAGTSVEIERRAERVCEGALATVQAVVESRSSTRLWLVTRGAQQTGYEAAAADPIQGTVLGFGRVAALEYPELSCTRVDLDPGPGGEAVDALWHELAADRNEPEVALRAGTRLVRRLERVAAPTSTPADPVTLEITSRGTIDNIRYVAADRPRPGRGEVEIAVRATGLNFRDVLNVLGMYPGQVGAPGDEVAGVITAVGDGVEDFRPGDEVVGTARACFATYAIGRAEMLVRKPAALTFAEAVTIPSAFLTAHYALDRIARLRAGERVLIHAAAGGVGLAAVQLAQRAGAEVFATAGSREKREFLQSLGVRHVMSSRTLEFVDDVMIATAGRGVDVVLNSLAGEFIPRSLSTLAPNGRFIEIGRTGVWEPQQVAATRGDVEYTVLFLVDEFARDAGEARRALAALVDRAATGDLRPLPARVFPCSATVDAFRYMAGARHIGKVVVSREHTAPERRAGVSADGTYLITGAFGALGLRVARRFVDEGARQLVLIGRREPSPETERALSELEQQGACIRRVVCDVGDARVLDLARRALAGWPPLRGVVHAAGALDDGVLAEQTAERFARVLAPKVAGTWNLHELTRSRPLDFFVMFSGGASLLGSRGQANYAAANAFLDAMAWHRQRHGLSALTINWGSWAESGMAASMSERDRRRFADRGIASIAVEHGLQILEQLLASSPAAQVGVLPIDWARYVPDTGFSRPFFARLVTDRPSPVQSPASGPRVLSEVLAAASPAEQPKILLAHVRECVLRVLGLSMEYDLDVNQGLRDLGLDSLMAVELKTVLQASVGRSLPATLAFDYPTAAALVKYLSETLGIGASAPVVVTTAAVEAATDYQRDVDALSDEEAEAQLAAELAALEQMNSHGN